MVKSILAVIVGLIVVPALVVLITAYWRFEHRVRAAVRKLHDAAVKEDSMIITADMLERLPEPVQRYMNYTGVVGKPIPSSVTLRQDGKMRTEADGAWMPIDAKQWYTVNPPGFVWDGTIRVGGLPIVRARDQYVGGKGGMTVKLAALNNIADSTGAEMDQGALTRYLSEMIWFPAAFLAPNVRWKAIDDCSAEVTLFDKGKSVSGILTVDGLGRPVNFEAKRFRSVGKGFELDSWFTPITQYDTYEGLNLPRRGKAAWHLAEGDLEYIDIEITALHYDP